MLAHLQHLVEAADLGFELHAVEHAPLAHLEDVSELLQVPLNCLLHPNISSGGSGKTSNDSNDINGNSSSKEWYPPNTQLTKHTRYSKILATGNPLTTSLPYPLQQYLLDGTTKTANAISHPFYHTTCYQRVSDVLARLPCTTRKRKGVIGYDNRFWSRKTSLR